MGMENFEAKLQEQQDALHSFGQALKDRTKSENRRTQDAIIDAKVKVMNAAIQLDKLDNAEWNSEDLLAHSRKFTNQAIVKINHMEDESVGKTVRRVLHKMSLGAKGAHKVTL
jgi:hypothetical protein